MAPYFLLLLLSAISTTSSQPTQFNITLGSSLFPTKTPTSWLSPSGRFAFGFYSERDGYAVGIWIVGNPQRTVVWTANRNDSPVSGNSVLLLKENGMLVLQTEQAPEKEKPISVDAGPASYASMLDSGKFVLYDSNSRIIWASFDSPTDTILVGQRLLAVAQLFSSISESNHSTGRFMLIMQNDGNLVLYPKEATTPTERDAYWNSGTYTAGNNVSLNFNEDGLLYLRNNTGFNIKNLTNGNYSSNQNSIYRATLDIDGIFRLYSHAFETNGSSTTSMLWELLTDKCSVKGICGFNGYCVLMDTQPACRCPRGFRFVNPEQWFLGCARNLADGVCTTKRQNMQYSISILDNTLWDDDPYLVLPSMTKEDCIRLCLGDCNCEAAIYKEQQCSMQKLPLRYGRRKLDDSTTSLIKFSDGISTSMDKEGSKKELRMEILIPVAFLALLFMGLTVSGFVIYKRRLWSYRKISEHNNIGLTEEISLRSFSYEEIEKATDGFKEELGRGAFGTVFKGCLSYNNRVVAVKRLEKVTEEGDREFLTEMRAIGRTHHKNLVRLLGFCNTGTNKLLVYEYMSNGSLADLLFTPERCPNWNERVKIALDVARGILYLHEECETQIIHCDIKPQNILMNEFHSAKISDFGTAKLMKPNQTRTITGIRGTRGYVAPEWHRNMPITVKADVYSFGIMLLEIISRRRSVEMEVAEDEVVLSDWVYDCFDTGELTKLVNGEEVDGRRLERMVKVGLWCIQDDPSLRPSMKKVLLMLEGTVEIPVPPSPSSFLSSMVMD